MEDPRVPTIHKDHQECAGERESAPLRSSVEVLGTPSMMAGNAFTEQGSLIS